MKKRDERELIPLTSYDQEPEGMTEEEAREFWDTHAFTEEYIASMPPISDDDFPPVGQLQEYGPILLDREVFRRARWLARRRGLSVEDFVGKLVHQELAAEEKRIRGTGPRTASDAGRGR
jgi:hypothetical protein